MSERIPSYRRHSSGQARVTLWDRATGKKKDFLLGPYGSRKSKIEYGRIIQQWEASGRRILEAASGPDLSVNELILAFWPYVEGHYKNADGTATKEVDEFRLSLKPLKRLFGNLAAGQFGPLRLKALREDMIAAGLSRATVNQRIWRVKKLFAWGVENEVVAAPVWQALLAVKGLQRGRSAARETEPVKPAPEAHIEAVLPFFTPTLAAMVKLQQLTGMRPGEVCRMRVDELDTSGTIWTYNPTVHKNQWRGKSRIVAIGPKAQQVLQPFLDRNGAEFLFRPMETMEHIWKIRRRNRKTTVQPSQADRRLEDPIWKPGQRYDTQSYGKAVARACRKAGVPKWMPNQLRHLNATMVRRTFGLEAAQAALGHSALAATQVYAERNLDLALKVAAAVG